MVKRTHRSKPILGITGSENRRILDQVGAVNARVIRSLRDINQKNLVRHLDSLGPMELTNVLTELALEKPELIPAIKRYKEKRGI